MSPGVDAQPRDQRLRAEAAMGLLWAQIHPEAGELRDHTVLVNGGPPPDPGGVLHSPEQQSTAQQ